MRLITTIKEYKKYLEYFENKTGILIYPKLPGNAYHIGEVLDNSDYYTEWDARDGYFFLEEDNVDAFDIIISDLEELLDSNDVDYHIEIRTNMNEEMEVNSDINSDKSVNISRYENDVEYYETNKNKLESILSLDEEDQEREANKLINGNKYLGLYWKHIKTLSKSENMEDKLRNSELTDEEKKNMQNELDELNNDMVLTKRNLEQTIKDDIKNIKEQ